MEILVGLFLLATFIVGVVLIMRGQSPIIVLLALAIIWPLTAGLANPGLSKDVIADITAGVIQRGADTYAPTIVTILFGAWFGQVLVGTGIAEAIIRSAVELAGDRPIVVLLVIDLVVAILFTSMYGVGAAIAIGVIVLPILMTLGVPPWLAGTSFTMSMVAAYMINAVQFSTVGALFMKNPSFDRYFPWLATMGVVCLLSVMAMGVIGMMRFGAVKHSSVSVAAAPARPNVPPYAYITPLVPVVVLVLLKWPMVPTFILSIVVALALTWTARSVKGNIDLFHKAFYDAFPDIATIAALWIICGMLIMAGQMPAVQAVFKPVFGPIIPGDKLALVLFFAIAAPLGLYRGPIAVVGTGAALLAIFLSVGKFPGEILYPFWMASLYIQSSLDPTGSWIIWTMGFTKVTHKQWLTTGVPFGWLSAAINLALAYFILPIS
ncbi:MAG: hypothetical protein ACYC3S_18480 [Chloroflexota bacterium]